MNRDDLVTWLDDTLESRGVQDYCPNGLQVEGTAEVKHVVCGVTACLELIEAAADRGADALLVHHGIIWGKMGPITRSFRRRVKALLDNDINLLGYHLPLDAHMEVGNGAMVAARLGLQSVQPFGLHRGMTVGVRGELAVPLSIDALSERVATSLDTTPLVFGHGPAEIRTVGVVTGAADKDFPQALAAGLDCYITGEASEFVMHFAREEGIHFIGAGHHATERWGVQALAARMGDELGVTWEFVDVPNPV
ncbi:MAG: dinuclear metal center YbgI/SA1388 family protein [Myxococcota bacterium]|jgi:dinuclear metal center YbgI/SA1388 family protein